MSLFVINTVFIGGFGTTKNFVIQSNPEGALIIKHNKTKIDDSFFIDYCGETPGQKKVTFFGDGKYFFTAEKRGYSAATLPVMKDSDTTISFHLDRIEGVSEEVFKKENLLPVTFTLLPVEVEVIIHSGVGQLDKKEYSSKLSKKVTEEFHTELIKAFNNNNKRVKQLSVLNESLQKDWENLSSELKAYLAKLNVNRLNYSSLPPYINRKVKDFKTFNGRIKQEPGSDSPYLLYIWGKCISETTGRKVGNFFASILGAATQGATMGAAQAGVINPGGVYIHNPSAFNSDSGTMVVLYVIDANSSEVVYMEPRVFSRDITDLDNLKKVASIISRFPSIDKKEDK